MREERGKAPLVLMEQVIMILVFSLAAAICIQAFVKASQISVHGEELDQAVSMSQTAAELMKASGGDLSTVKRQLEDQDYQVQTEADHLLVTGSGSLVMKISLVAEETSGIGSASVTVNDEKEEIYQLEVKWQEAADE